MIEVLINKELVCKLASCSLEGITLKAIHKETGEYKMAPVKIVFFGSSLEYCEKYDGPEHIIMPDYVPFSIAESILNMTKQGWSISLELRLETNHD